MDFIFDPGLVLYLPLYELDGASLQSKDKHGHIFTVTGALWKPDGRLFDGADDYISESGTDVLRVTGAQTHLAWVNLESVSDAGIMGRGMMGTSNAATSACGMWINSTGIQWQYSDGSSAGNLASTGLIPTDRWVFIGTIWDGTSSANSVIFFIDGLQDSTAQSPITSINLNPDVEDYFKLGIRYVALSYGDTQGMIGEAWHYNRALTPLEIQRIYLASKWRYR